MAYGQLVEENNIPSDQSDIESKTIAREPLIQRLIDDSRKYYHEKFGVEISIIDDASLKISYLYFLMCFTHIKPVIEDRTRRFKMASLMELIIVKEQIFKSEYFDDSKNRELNAQFGMIAALSMINSLIYEGRDGFFCSTMSASVDEKIKNILEDHKLWLRTKNLNDMPIFINGQFYELIELIHGAPLMAHAY